MKKFSFIVVLLLSINCLNLKGQINVNCDGRVLLGAAADAYATLNITPQYSAPGATNLMIGNWWNNTNGLISMGVHQDYAWIQSWHVKPLHINRMGNNTIFGSESVESVGIGYGMITPSAKLDVIGNIYATGTITSSDSRFKSNIEAIDLKGKNYKGLGGVTYNYNIREKGLTIEGLDTSKIAKMEKEFYKRKHFGFIAQEVKEIFPELVYEDN